MRLLAVVYMAPNLQNTTTASFCFNDLLGHSYPRLCHILPKGEHLGITAGIFTEMMKYELKVDIILMSIIVHKVILKTQ